MVINYTRPKYYPEQLQAFFPTNAEGKEFRYAICFASTKAGKTVGAYGWQIEQVLPSKPGSNHWWIAPVHAQARIPFERLKIRLAPYIKAGVVKTNDTEGTLTFPGGRVWWFKSGEKPDNLYGEDVHSVVLDEFSRLREASWHAIRSTISSTEAPVRMIGNVKTKAHWSYKLAERVRQGLLPEWHYQKITAYDAARHGVLSLKEIEDAKGLLPDAVFKELYLAEPTEDGTNPFPLSLLEPYIISESPTKEVSSWGWDLARKQDKTAGVGISPEGYTSQVHIWNQVPWRETIRRICTIVGKGSGYVDATGVGDAIIERLVDDGSDNLAPYVFTARSKIELFDSLLVSIQNGELYFTQEIADQLNCLEYGLVGKQVGYITPDGYEDDVAMAMALANKARRLEVTNVQTWDLDW